MSLQRTIKRIIGRTLPEEILHAVAMKRADEPLLPILAARSTGGTFVDIGANDGMFIHHLRASARRIVAFEPVASLAAKLRARYPEVAVHDCALSDHPGEAILYVPSLHRDAVFSRASLNADANPGFTLEPQTVCVRRLDDFAIDDVRAIKIDVEGHEEDVLKGALRTIETMRPVLAVEIEERHHPGRSGPLMRWIESLGYESFHHDGTQLVSAADADFAALQQVRHQKAAFGRANSLYVNNFLFLPS